MKYWLYALGVVGALVLGVLFGRRRSLSQTVLPIMSRGRYAAIEKEVKKEAKAAKEAKRDEIQNLTNIDVRSRYASEAISTAGRNKRDAVRARLRESASGTGSP